MNEEKRHLNFIPLVIIFVFVLGGILGYYVYQIVKGDNEDLGHSSNNDLIEYLEKDNALVKRLYNMVAVDTHENDAYKNGFLSGYIAYKNLPQEVIENKNCADFGYDSNFSYKYYGCSAGGTGIYGETTLAIKGETLRNKIKEIYGQDIKYTDQDFYLRAFSCKMYHYDANTDYYVLLSFEGGGLNPYEEKKQIEYATKQNDTITLIERIDAFEAYEYDSSSYCKYIFKYEKTTKNYIFKDRVCEKYLEH